MANDVAIVGYGEPEYHKDNQHYPLEYMAIAIEKALEDSGLSHQDIDGLSTASFSLNHTVTTLARRLGISGEWLLDGSFGGASSISAMRRGKNAIERGVAETVLVTAADAYTPTSHMELSSDFPVVKRNYLTPFGFGGANGQFALVQRRHMHQYGTTREQLSNISVTQRKHAQLNENALLQDDLTKEQYLDARPIVEPIHLYDCVLPCGGGGAIILSTTEKASTLDTEPVYIRGSSEYHNQNPTKPFEPKTGFTYCKNIFNESGISHNDIDAVQLYDDYPIMAAIQLEDLGFCSKGEGGNFVSEHDISFTGDCPINTGGGQLSVGQAGAAGGILGPIEAIRQVRNEGNDRQVPDCKHVLTTGYGRTHYGGGMSSSVAILSSEEH